MISNAFKYTILGHPLMRKSVVAVVGAFCWTCALPAQTNPAVSRDTTSVIGLTDRALILSSVIIARYGITRDAEPFVDGCSVRAVLATDADAIALLRSDARAFVLPSNAKDCSESSHTVSRPRLIFKSITTHSNVAVVQAAFTFPGVGAHLETYRLLGSRSPAGRTWGVIEIRISDFVTI